MNNKNNKNNKDIVGVRIFHCKDGNVLITFVDPNLGFKYIVVKAIKNPATAEIVEVQQVYADHINTFKAAEELLKTFWPTAKLDPGYISSSYRPEIFVDGSNALLKYGYAIAPLDLIDPKDLSNTRTFKQFLIDIIKNPTTPEGVISDIELIELTASDKRKYDLKKREIKSEDSWVYIPQEQRPAFIPVVSDALKLSTEKRAEFKCAMDHILYETAGESSVNIAFKGPGGTGKTTMAEVIALVLNLPYAVLTGHPQMEKDDFWMHIIPNVNTSGWTMQETLFFMVAKYGGVLAIGEPNAMPASVLLSLNDTVYGNNRSITIHGITTPVHPNAIFILTYNEGYEGTQPMNEAFKERFKEILCEKIPCDLYAEYLAEAWYAQDGIDKDAVKEFVKFSYNFMDYMEEHFADLDKFSSRTPNTCTRDISRNLKECLVNQNIKQVFFRILRTALSAVDEAEVLTNSAIAAFEPQIEELERKFFQSEEALKEIEDAYQDFLSWGVPPEPEKDAKEFFAEAEALYASKLDGAHV